MDSDNNKSARYAHSEGHVGLCFDDDGSHLLTCGCDGDVRIWKDIDDDDPVSHRAGDSVFAVSCKNKRFFTAADDNAVRAHTFPDGQADGILVRFTAPVTHMCFNTDGTKLYAGASDFQIKVVDTEASSQRVLIGHDAPVLGLSVHPQEKYLASSSCDGTVKLWNLEDNSCLKTLSILPKSNDFSASTTLAQMTWTKDGKKLAVPVEKEVRVYDVSTWDVSFILTDSSIQQTVSLCTLSPCGRFLAAGCRDGCIVVWDMENKKVINREANAKRAAVSGLAWNPNGEGDLAYCDTQGNLGVISDMVSQALRNKTIGETVATEYADLFDDDDDMMVEASSEATKMKNLIDSDDEDDIGRTQHKSRPLLDDDASRDASIAAPSLDGDAESSRMSPAPPIEPAPPVIRAPPTTAPQPPFQSSATPTHLPHRFMVWNSVGLIRQYNTEEENSIDVEFHDTATHHPLHVTNTLGHTMAALSDQVVLLACEGDDDTPSQVVCTHFGSWDESKEWSVAMPTGEEIQALVLGDGWAAVATDRRQVRLFTVAGVQREIFSIPGRVVTLAGHGDQLLIVYHRGVGLPGDQCLGVMLLRLSGRQKAEISGAPLPISHKSTLVWAGFSAEGTPFSVDSAGIVYMLNKRLGNTWSQVANTKARCKGKSDHYWIVGFYENPSQIRAIMCKGARYPPTLPRPNVNILPYELPLCELSTDKGQLEEAYWRSRLLTNHLQVWASQGYEVEESAKSTALITQQETLIKLFALACKTGREARALEVSELMAGQQAVQLAIKYASRLRKIQLAQKLNDVARAKAEEELQEEEDDEEEMSVVPSRFPKRNASKQEEELEEEDGEEEGKGNNSQEIFTEMDDEEQEEDKQPLLKFGQKSKKSSSKLLTSQTRGNPFRVQSQTSTQSSTRGSSVFDQMRVNQKSSPALQEEKTEIKPRGRSKLLPTTKKVQPTLAGKKIADKNRSQENGVDKPNKKSAFQLWMLEHQPELAEEHPDVDEAELTLIGAKAFKTLSAEELKEWKEKAAQTGSENSATPPTGGEKRKRTLDDLSASANMKTTKDTDSTPPAQKKKPLSNTTNAKLSAFSFNK